MQPNAQINAKKIQRRHRPSRQAYDPPRPSSQETPPIPGALHTQRGVVSPPWTGFHLTQEWTAPSRHARATGSRRPASSHQCPEPLPALQTGAQTLTGQPSPRTLAFRGGSRGPWRSGVVPACTSLCQQGGLHPQMPGLGTSETSWQVHPWRLQDQEPRQWALATRAEPRAERTLHFLTVGGHFS